MINVYAIHRCLFIIIHILIYLLIADSCYSKTRHVKVTTDAGSQPSRVPIGVILDTNSPLGSMLHLCIEMSLSDFYAKNPNYTTMLQLHIRTAQSVVDANFAVVDLLRHEQVEGIIGPQGSTQDTFISELGQKFHVPIISVTARSSLSQNNFFVRATMDDLTQARALAAFCQELQWPQALLLYEDTEYGHQFQSHLGNAFRDVGIGLVHQTAIPPWAGHKSLRKLLASLEQQETKVFIVHTNNPSLGFRLINAARKVGLMREGSAWVITDSISNFLSSMDSPTRDSMEGVVGMRPYVAPSKELRYFQERWERNNSRASMDLNVVGLWAYDTMTALATAVENLGPVYPQYPCSSEVARVSSSYGPRLLRELSSTRFRGLSGYFEVVDGRLKPSDFEIVNLIGTGERRVGFWNPHRGIVRELNSIYSTWTKGLKNVVWPGDSTIKPKGWAIPPSGSLRVGVPWKPGFTEFVNAVIDPATNETSATGFAVDIFLYALKQMPFPINYTFCIYNESTSTNWSYDSMLHEIPEKYDMVVADTTIWAPRASYVDFSLPYSESGVVLVLKNSKPLNMWTFTMPFRWDLWLTIFAASLFMGLFIWRLESRPTALPPVADDSRLKIAFLVTVAALAFPETAFVTRKMSLFLLVCWLFTAYVLTQGYTANLSAILTLDKLHFSFSDDHYIGYHRGSFTYEFLTEKLNISPTRLRPYSSLEEYNDAMRRGSKRGGIDAIFDEFPYMKLLINRYYSRYKIVGPTFRTDGLGFAFPVGSPLVAHFSRAILNVTQGPEMTGLEQKNFGPGYSSQDPLLNTVSQGASSLTSHDFAGLFIILAGLNLLAFLAAITGAFSKLKKRIEDFNKWIDKYRKSSAYAPVANEAVVGVGAGDVGGGHRDPANGEIEVERREQNNEGPII